MVRASNMGLRKPPTGVTTVNYNDNGKCVLALSDGAHIDPVTSHVKFREANDTLSTAFSSRIAPPYYRPGSEFGTEFISRIVGDPLFHKFEPSDTYGMYFLKPGSHNVIELEVNSPSRSLDVPETRDGPILEDGWSFNANFKVEGVSGGELITTFHDNLIVSISPTGYLKLLIKQPGYGGLTKSLTTDYKVVANKKFKVSIAVGLHPIVQDIRWQAQTSWLEDTNIKFCSLYVNGTDRGTLLLPAGSIPVPRVTSQPLSLRLGRGLGTGFQYPLGIEFPEIFEGVLTAVDACALARRAEGGAYTGFSFTQDTANPAPIELEVGSLDGSPVSYQIETSSGDIYGELLDGEGTITTPDIPTGESVSISISNQCYISIESDVSANIELTVHNGLDTLNGLCEGKLMLETFKLDSAITPFSPEVQGYHLNDYSRMFKGCVSLVSFVSEVTFYANFAVEMFEGCTNLTVVDGMAEVRYLVNATNMFKDCTSITNSILGISFLALPTTRYFVSTFENCTSLDLIPITFYRDADIPATIIIDKMFKGCSGIVNPQASVSGHEVVSSNEIFRDCINAVSLSLDTPSSVSIEKAFYNCPSLTCIKLIQFQEFNTATSGLFDLSHNITSPSLILPPGETDQNMTPQQRIRDGETWRDPSCTDIGFCSAAQPAVNLTASTPADYKLKFTYNPGNIGATAPVADSLYKLVSGTWTLVASDISSGYEYNTTVTGSHSYRIRSVNFCGDVVSLSIQASIKITAGSWTSTGSETSFKVPNGVTQIHISAIGGGASGGVERGSTALPTHYPKGGNSGSVASAYRTTTSGETVQLSLGNGGAGFKQTTNGETLNAPGSATTVTVPSSSQVLTAPGGAGGTSYFDGSDIGSDGTTTCAGGQDSPYASGSGGRGKANNNGGSTYSGGVYVAGSGSTGTGAGGGAAYLRGSHLGSPKGGSGGRGRVTISWDGVN